MATTELATYNGGIIRSMEDVERSASLMAKSGFFQDAAQAAQAAVKIMAGHEIGIGAFASMTGIHIIKGRPAIGANIMAAKVKASGKYDYIVNEMTDTACRLTFYQHGKEIGKSEFTLADAKKAGTQNLDKFPRNMLFARAISNGVKWFCPDVFMGVTVYTPEEMGAQVDEDGDVITVTAQPVTSKPAPVVISGPSTDGNDVPLTQKEKETLLSEEAAYHDACEVINSKGVRYGDLDTETLTHIFNNPKTPPEKTIAAATIINWRTNL